MPMKELVPRLALPMPPTYPSCCRNKALPFLIACTTLLMWTSISLYRAFINLPCASYVIALVGSLSERKIL